MNSKIVNSCIEYIEKGDQSRKLGQFDEAINLYQKALEADPKSARAYHYLGETLIIQKKLDPAIASFRRAIEFDPTFCWSYHCLGNALFWQDNLDEAISNYKQAIKINPNQTVFYEQLGKTLANKNNFKEAIDCYQKAIEMGAKSEELYCNLAQALTRKKRWEDAIGWYRKAIELNPNAHSTYHDLGDTFAKISKLDEALASYRRAIDIEPNAALSYQNMGDVFLLQGNTEEAVLAYQKALEIDPDLAWAYYNLGEIFRHQNRLDEAIICYTRSIEIDPFLPSPFIQLMFLQAQPHQLDGVVSCYKQFIEKNPKHPWSYVRLGDTLSKQGKIGEAIENYKQASFLLCSMQQPDYTRQYWKSGTLSRPDFIIVGPMKTATSALYEYIIKHPKVLPCIKKEVHFFNHDGKFEYGLDWYLSHFCPTVEGQGFITGEASPGYLVNNIHDRVFKLCPNMKSIALVRNPVDRAFSHYQHNLKYGFERRSFEEAIASEMEALQDVEDPSKAAETWEWWIRPGYILMGLYVYFIEKWIPLFPSDQFLVLNNEDLLKNPAGTMKQVFEFLGVSDRQMAQYPKYNAGSYSPVQGALREQLSEYFRPHNQRLEDCLGWKLDWK